MTAIEREKLGGEISYALNGFNRYMNRPISKVHVYTWRLANLEFGQCDTLHLFRALRGYRSREVNQIRFNVAQILKWRRTRKSIRLPIYDEATAKYITP